MKRQSESWSTPDADLGTVLRYWEELIGNRLIELQIEPDDSDVFRGKLVDARLGSSALSLLEATPQRVYRSRASVAKSRQHDVFLVQLRQGRMRFEQYGREANLTEGQCVITDGSDVWSLHCPVPTTALVLQLPMPWVTRYIPSPAQLAAVPINTEAGWGAALGAALQALDPATIDQMPLPSALIAEQIVVLLSLSNGPQSRTTTTAQERLLHRARLTMRELREDSELGPTEIAHALGISRRHLHRLFAGSGTTFCEELLAMRLEQACAALANQRNGRLTVAEVAFQCGFADPGHFTRRFRERTGLSPSAYRTLHH